MLGDKKRFSKGVGCRISEENHKIAQLRVLVYEAAQGAFLATCQCGCLWRLLINDESLGVKR
jgi:hypothetical protein